MLNKYRILSEGAHLPISSSVCTTQFLLIPQLVSREKVEWGRKLAVYDAVEEFVELPGALVSPKPT